MDMVGTEQIVSAIHVQTQEVGHAHRVASQLENSIVVFVLMDISYIMGLVRQFVQASRLLIQDQAHLAHNAIQKVLIISTKVHVFHHAHKEQL